MSSAGHGPMLVVDASVIVEVLVGGLDAAELRVRLGGDGEHAAPHVVDVEAFGVVRREFLGGRLERTAADQAIEDLAAWPAERFDHRLLQPRAWELRDTVRGWDAMYVALAEALGAVLLTRDERLARAVGPQCQIVVV